MCSPPAPPQVPDEEVVRVAREHAEKRRALIAKQRERAAKEAISRVGVPAVCVCVVWTAGLQPNLEGWGTVA